MKKFLSLVLALVMILSCSTMAFAAVENPDDPQLLLRYTTTRTVKCSCSGFTFKVGTIKADITGNDSTGEIAIVHSVKFTDSKPSSIYDREIHDYRLENGNLIVDIYTYHGQFEVCVTQVVISYDY